ATARLVVIILDTVKATDGTGERCIELAQRARPPDGARVERSRVTLRLPQCFSAQAAHEVALVDAAESTFHAHAAGCHVEGRAAQKGAGHLFRYFGGAPPQPIGGNAGAEAVSSKQNRPFRMARHQGAHDEIQIDRPARVIGIYAPVVLATAPP